MSQLLFDSEEISTDDAAAKKLAKQSKFIAKCFRVIEREWADHAASLMIFQDEIKPCKGYSAHHDDGFLHVTHNPSGIRASFDVQFCQTLKASITNDNTMRILEALGLKDSVDGFILLDPDEDEDDDEYCPCCGRCH